MVVRVVGMGIFLRRLRLVGIERGLKESVDDAFEGLRVRVRVG